MQPALFDYAPEMPAGFRYQSDFLTPEQEASVLDSISSLNFKNFRWHEYTGKRQTVTFGWAYRFDDGEIAPAEPIPQFLEDLRNKAARWADLDNSSIEQALVTRYDPGAGIGWHRDAPPFGIIVGISLLSDCRFRMRLERERVTRELAVERRSIYLLDGPARTVWQHGIPPAKETRYSITFRTMRRQNYETMRKTSNS
jgi:alkylated DNA repair dioxygenase AlkB